MKKRRSPGQIRTVYVFARGFPVVSRCTARAVEDARPYGVNGHFCRDASISETATLRADLGIGPYGFKAFPLRGRCPSAHTGAEEVEPAAFEWPPCKR